LSRLTFQSLGVVNSRTGKDDRVQAALEACIFCSSFPVWEMRPTVNPVVSFSAIELLGLPRRQRAKYFEEANANGRELLHHTRKRVKMHSFDVLCRALMFILLTNTSSSTDSALCRKDFFLSYDNLLSELSVLVCSRSRMLPAMGQRVVGQRTRLGIHCSLVW
jgi:hypothetical protein